MQYTLQNEFSFCSDIRLIVGEYHETQGSHFDRREQEDYWPRLDNVLPYIILIQAALESEYIHRLYITRVLHEYDCDTFFPEFDQQQFKSVE